MTNPIPARQPSRAAVYQRHGANWGRFAAPVPTPLTSFVGRERDVEQIGALLRRDGVRLVTLTGPGGVGKTRLAIAVVNHVHRGYPDGVAFVALAPLRRPDQVGAAIAQALGVGEIGDIPIQAAVLNALAAAEMLMVLDNFEHVADASPLVAALLHGCPHLTVLVTSRARLRVSGELEYPVPPLSLPAAGAAMRKNVAESPAVRLFVERATAVDPGFALIDENAASIAAICARLDGLPLAIELAAARSKVLPPDLLLPRLARGLPLLTGGPRDVPARLQTMRNAIVWSHDLLTPEEQVLFRRLAVFSGGFDLDAAERVTGFGCQVTGSGTFSLAPETRHPSPVTLDIIASLVDKSLLVWTTNGAGGRRFDMLETIREFALERLAAAGEGEAVRDAHAAYFGVFDERLDPNRVAPGERVDDRLWRTEVDYANFQAALTRMAESNDGEGVLRLAGALAIFWHHRGNLAEGRRWLEWALANTAACAATSRAQALVGLSLIVWSQSDHELASALAQDAHAIAEATGARELVAFSVHMLGLAAMTRGHWEAAAECMEEALGLWREVGLASDEAMALRALSRIACETGDLETCRRRAEDALAMYRVLGHPSGAAGALAILAQVAIARGDDGGAALAYQEGLRLWSETNTRWMAAAGQTGAAATSVFPRWAGIDDRQLLFHALSGLARVAAAQAQPEHAAALAGAADLLAADTGLLVYPTAGESHERAKAAIRAALGDDAFARHHAAGQQYRLDEAVALAMTISAAEPANGSVAGASRSSRGVGALTPREREVLRLLVAGKTDRVIATALFIGHRTVQDHVSHIIAKLGVANRTEAAAAAVRHGVA